MLGCWLVAWLRCSFTAIPTIGLNGEYDPWLDVTDDGYIGVDDVYNVASHFGAEGQSITKAGMLYDSGWINVTNQFNENYTVTHNLNMTREEMLVDARGRAWNTYGGPGWDDAYALVQTADSGYALTGWTTSNGAGGSDFWLVKTDGSGNEQWNKTYGGTDYDEAYALMQTADGGYALAGRTGSYGAGYYDFWLVKTDVESGRGWVDSDANSITLHRGITDIYWNYVRVRIWRPRETP